MAAIAEQIFLIASSAGWAHTDDCVTLKLYQLGEKTKDGADNDTSISTREVTKSTIENLLKGIHATTSMEVVSFGRKLGLDVSIISNVVKTAAGSNAMLQVISEDLSQSNESWWKTKRASTVRQNLVRPISLMMTILFVLLISD